MALLIISGTVAFGSSTIRMAVPLFGLALLLGVLWAFKLIFAEAISWKKSLMHLPVGAFAVYALLRYCTSPLEYSSRLELFDVGVCTLLYFVAACNFYHRGDRLVLAGALLVLGMGESALALWQFLTKATTLFTFPRPEMYVFRGGGTFFCPNHLAGFLEMVLGILVARLALNTSSQGSVQKMIVGKVFLAFGLFVIVIGLVATLSRGGWVAATISLGVLVLWGGWNWARLWPRFLVAGIGVGLLFLLAFKTEGISNRFLHSYIVAKTVEGQTTDLENSMLGPRLKIWISTIGMIREHPLWGTGGGTWEWFYPKHRPEKLPSNPEYAHNDLLNLLSDYGLMGLALLTMALTCFYGHAYGLSRGKISPEEHSFAVGSAMAVTALLVHSLVDFNLHILSNAALFAAIMGFTVAMEENPEREDRKIMSSGARYALAIGLLVVCAVGGWFIGRTALAYHYNAMGDYAKSVINYEEALTWYRKALHLDGKNPAPYARIGDICLNQSQWRVNPAHRKERDDLANQAIDWYHKALKLNPYFVEVLLRMARAYEIVQEKQPMLDCCQRVVELDPMSPVVYTFLAKFYLREKDLTRAEEAALNAKKRGWLYYDTTPDRILEEIQARRKEEIQAQQNKPQ